MSTLLFGWGFGLIEVLAPAGFVGLAFAVFAFEVALCHLWLRRFRFGPLEWLWRVAVYGRLPAMRL